MEFTSCLTPKDLGFTDRIRVLALFNVIVDTVVLVLCHWEMLLFAWLWLTSQWCLAFVFISAYLE